MAKTNDKKKVITGKVRLCYPRLFKAEAFGDGQEAKYSVCILIPEDDKKTHAKINNTVEAAKEEGISSKWGGKEPKKLKLPLRDGEERDGEEYEGMYFLNASSTRKPHVVDKDVQEILDPDEIYPGCYGRVSLNFYPFDSNGNRGIAVGLNNVQKLADGERLGGSVSSAEDDFDDDWEDDDDF